MADRTNKATGIKVISQVGRDPEANRYKRVKEEEERLRADMRRDSKIKRTKERATGSRLSAGYLEGNDFRSTVEKKDRFQPHFGHFSKMQLVNFHGV